MKKILFIIISILYLFVIPVSSQDAAAPAETLSQQKAALDHEYQELSALRSELERQKAEAVTEPKILEYNKNIELFNQKVKEYDQRREAYEKESLSAAEQDDVVLQKSDPAQRSDASTMEDQAAPPPEAEVDPETRKKVEMAAAFEAEKQGLTVRKEGIDKEYADLMKEKDALNAKRKPRMTMTEVNALKAETEALNSRIGAYDTKRQDFDRSVQDYNKRVQDAGMAVQENQPTTE